MKDELLWIAVGAFLIGAIASTLTIYATHRHYHEIIKTTIGEFIIHDGRIYSVYEMERNIRGEMVAK
jgi:hypothetical protein